jgi:hypothetical protein
MFFSFSLLIGKSKLWRTNEMMACQNKAAVNEF